jgi:hypothetical protein
MHTSGYAGQVSLEDLSFVRGSAAIIDEDAALTKRRAAGWQPPGTPAASG